jgi:hypothetical protein
MSAKVPRRVKGTFVIVESKYGRKRREGTPYLYMASSNCVGSLDLVYRWN